MRAGYWLDVEFEGCRSFAVICLGHKHDNSLMSFTVNSRWIMCSHLHAWRKLESFEHNPASQLNSDLSRFYNLMQDEFNMRWYGEHSCYVAGKLPCILSPLDQSGGMMLPDKLRCYLCDCDSDTRSVS